MKSDGDSAAIFVTPESYTDTSTLAAGHTDAGTDPNSVTVAPTSPTEPKPGASVLPTTTGVATHEGEEKRRTGQGAAEDEAKTAPTAGLAKKKSMPSLQVNMNRQTAFVNKAARAGVAGEKTRSDDEVQRLLAKITNSDDDAQAYIQAALKKNRFLQNFSDKQLKIMSAHTRLQVFSKGEKIIEQGKHGNELFVLAEGKVDIMKDNKHCVTLSGSEVFGEVALLHNQPRNATVQASTLVRAWVLAREIFQAINQYLGRQDEDKLKTFLRSTGKFPASSFSDTQLGCIAAALREVSYEAGDVIIKQGNEGDNFYIIKEGTVIVSQRGDDGHEKDLRDLGAGTPFGELWRVDQGKTGGRRTATIRAKEKVVCYMLEMNDFVSLIEAQSFTDTVKGPQDDVASKAGTSKKGSSINDKFRNITMEHLKKTRTLGAGAFGRVLLVRCDILKEDFALKCMAKSNICKLHQQAHIFSERDILMKVKNPNIVRLYRTFRDNYYVYLLMEPCLGGDLFSVLQAVVNASNFQRGFSENDAKFYISCNILAFDYLHQQSIAYRDLKPENLMLDSRGYCKVVDFGFAKTVCGTKTYTFCGTPEYMAPEVILGSGHDTSADLWSLGILVYECLAGQSPFPGMDVPDIQVTIKSVGVGQRPPSVPPVAFDFICSLCRERPSRRLGSTGRDLCSKASRHRWFRGFDWNAVRNRCYPHVPDMSNLRPVKVKFPAVTKPQEEMSGWDEFF